MSWQRGFVFSGVRAKDCSKVEKGQARKVCKEWPFLSFSIKLSILPFSHKFSIIISGGVL